MYDYVRLLGGTNELHLVSWNRNGRPDAAVPKGISKSFVFGDHVEDADPIQKKLPHFARFRKFALGVIDSEAMTGLWYCIRRQVLQFSIA